MFLLSNTSLREHSPVEYVSLTIIHFDVDRGSSSLDDLGHVICLIRRHNGIISSIDNQQWCLDLRRVRDGGSVFDDGLLLCCG